MYVHLIDGTFELFRAYYGSPPSTDVNGKEVGATRGLARSLLSLLGERDVTHVAVAFDHVIESFRNGVYPGYKTGDGIDPALYSQSYSRRMPSAGRRCRIASPNCALFFSPISLSCAMSSPFGSVQVRRSLCRENGL
jgi:hypothetical protein